MNIDKYNKLLLGIILLILIFFLGLFIIPKTLKKTAPEEKKAEKSPAALQEITEPTPDILDSERAIPARNLPQQLEF